MHIQAILWFIIKIYKTEVWNLGTFNKKSEHNWIIITHLILIENFNKFKFYVCSIIFPTKDEKNNIYHGNDQLYTEINFVIYSKTYFFNSHNSKD